MSDINNRIKTLRKELDISQESFGEKIGVKKAAVSKWENGNANLSETVIELICKVYNVNKLWLTEGNGEMFAKQEDDIMELVDQLLDNDNPFLKNLLQSFISLGEDEIKGLQKFMDNYVEIKKNAG